MVKKIKGTAFILLSFVIAFTCFNINEISADMPVQDNTAIGQAYDGIDFDELMSSRVYLGAMNQVTKTSGNKATTWEDNPTPILWKVVGEDGDQSGNKDNSMALYSEYVVDAMKFTASGNPVWSEWSGEGDYDASYVQKWLNSETTYGGRDGFGTSFKITETDSSISYDAELNAIVRSTVDTYFIAQGSVSESEVVITNTNDIFKYTNSVITQGEWASYFGSSATPFSSWPVTQTNAIAYIPIGVVSYSGQPSHMKVFYNADGLPKTAVSEDYSIGTMGQNEEILKGKTKYGTGSIYWLRNPNGLRMDSGSTRVYSVTAAGALYTYHPTAAEGAGVRPITKLDPETIVMTHEIVSTTPPLSNQILEDKEDGTEWNYESSTDRISNYKLTLVSDKVELNSLNDANDDPITSSDLVLESGGSIKVSSDDYIGDYLAYKIVHTNASGEREIVAYGTSKGSTPDELEIKGIKSTIDNSDLGAGDYTLYIWAQGEDTEGKDGASVHSYEASNQLTFDLTVKEKSQTYTVTYHGNTSTRGTAPTDVDSPYNAGSTVTVLDEDDLVKTDHKFIGWSTTATGTVDYEAGDSFVINADTDLYAVWEPLPTPTYTVTFESNGGSAVASQTGMNVGDYVIEPTDPTRTGYKFIGWYLDDGTFLNAWDFDNDTISGDTTLYAKWEKDEEPVTPPVTPDPTEPDPDPQSPTNPDPQDPNGSTPQANPSTKPSGTTEGKDTSEVVETGDTTNMIFYISLLLLSSMYFVGRKKFNNK